MTSAISVSIVNSIGGRRPMSTPMLSTTSSTSPRVFINTPSAIASRLDSASTREARSRARRLAGDRDRQDCERFQHEPRRHQQVHVRAQAGEREKQRKQQHRDQRLDAHGQQPFDLLIPWRERAEEEGAEQRMDAQAIGRGGGRDRRDEQHGHPAFWRPRFAPSIDGSPDERC